MGQKLDKLKTGVVNRLAWFQNVQPVTPLYYTLMVVPIRPIILKAFRIRVVNRDVVPYNRPAIILANHVALFDPVWLYSAMRGSAHFVTTEDIFRRPIIGRLLHWYGCFPKRKGAQDFSSVKNIIRMLRKGRPIAVFPEGIRTWDGRLATIAPGIATLIQRMKVPVITCRQEGAYIAHPRWASRWRGFPVTFTFDKLYDADGIPEDPTRILVDIEERLRVDDYGIPVDEARYRIGGLALDVTKLLYRCPNCQTYEGLKVMRPYASNRVECASCFSSWRLTVSNRLIPLDESGLPLDERLRLDDVYSAIKAFPLKPLTMSNPPGLGPDEILYLKSRPHLLRREDTFPRIRALSVGKLYLTNQRLIFRNRYRIVFDAPLTEVKGVSTEAGNRLNFVWRGHVYNITFRNESLLKWFDTIVLLRGDEEAE